MIRAIRPAAVARDDASLITGWNIALNVGYTVTLSVSASAVVVILASADGSKLIGSVALVGADQPVTITPVTGQTIGTVDADLGWHLLVTTDGTEGERMITLDPMVDLADEIHPIYTDSDMGSALRHGGHQCRSLLCGRRERVVPARAGSWHRRSGERARGWLGCDRADRERHVVRGSDGTSETAVDPAGTRRSLLKHTWPRPRRRP